MSATARAGEAGPKSRILAAATALFAEKGFDGAGVDEIARRAGVNKAMLYYHVGDKATLYATIALAYLRRLHAAVQFAAAASDDPTVRIRGIHTVFLDAFRDDPDWARLLLREVADGGVHLPPEALATMAAVMGVTRQVVEEGQRRGALRGVNPLLAHLLVVGSAIFVTNAQRLRGRFGELGLTPPGMPADVMAAAGELTDLILHGLAARPRSGGKR